MIWLGMAYLLYMVRDLNTGKKQLFWFVFLSVWSAGSSIVTALLPIEMHNENGSIYTSGAAVMNVYVITLLYILSTMFVAVAIRERRNSRRGQAVIVATLLWILAACIQFIHNKLLIVGFAGALGVMILYIVLENPDSHLDRQLGCFNSYALNQYLNLRMNRPESFHVLDISIKSLRALEDRGFNVLDKTREITHALEDDKDLFLFKNFNYGIVLISLREEKIQAACDKLLEMLHSGSEFHRDILVLHVKDAQKFETADELLRFLTYMRTENRETISNVVYASDSIIGEYRNKLTIEKEIDLALKEDRVEVYMQPICGQGENSVVSAEALIRIRKNDGSLLSPGVFIPVAEETRQIKELGERVLEKVCAFLRDTDALALGLQYVDVNLSAVQCDDNTMAERLNRIVENNGIDPKHIVFEITETAVTTVKETLLENMNAMTALGYRFALDDFGKGGSNLVYLVEMPAQILKLDIDIAKAYFSNKKANCVVKSVVKMAHELGFSLVVEGIETEEEAKGINVEGIDFIQGYYYSHPLPATQFIEYLCSTMRTTASPALQPVCQTHTSDILHDDELAGRKVVLVEDNLINSEMTKDILEDMGLTVDTAYDGMQAVTMLRDSSALYDIIFMDIRMPIMDGYEASRRIRAMSDTGKSNIPIVALTATSSDDDRERAFSCGMNDHLTKPADPVKMLEVIRRLLSKTTE